VQAGGRRSGARDVDDLSGEAGEELPEYKYESHLPLYEREAKPSAVPVAAGADAQHGSTQNGSVMSDADYERHSRTIRLPDMAWTRSR